MSSANNECITVVVRCRPMNRKENDENRKSIIEVDPENRQVGIRNPDAGNEAPKYFTFDATYDEKTQQKFFYEESCFNVIESTLEGFNSTIFAYGQTGCGKSFTMQGPSTTDENLRGVIPNSFSHIFQFVKTTKNIEFLIRCSYLELYNEEIRDLLIDPKVAVKCELKEDPNKGVYVKGLTDVVVESPEDLHKMLDKGLTNRTTAATLMNSESSRSHSIFTIIVEMNTKDETTGKDMLRVGKLNLVDLAGSERAKKTGATDKTLKEGIRINLSLSVLGNVISALAEGGKFIPYRDSKLTRLLQDSLGGNTKTMMVAAISPADYNYDETLSTLRYANRAKNIKNKPKINEDPKDAMIREFKAEIERLRKLLVDQAGASALFAQMGGGNLPPEAMTRTEGQQAASVSSKSAKQPQQSSGAPSSQLEMIEEVQSEANSPVKKSMITEQDQSEIDNYEQGYPNDESIETNIQTNDAFAVGEGRKEGDTPTGEAFASPNARKAPANQGGTPSSSAAASEEMKPKHQSQQQQEMSTTPREMEEQIRGEIENRLHQLEHMLVHSEEPLFSGSTSQKETQSGKFSAAAGSMKGATPTNNGSTKDALNGSGGVVIPLLPLKTPEQIAEEEKQIQEYKERKKRAKKRREEKQQREVQKILEEKKQIEEELEELKQNLLVEKASSAVPSPNPINTEEELDDYANKKLQKLKKRYEKKLQASKEELEDLRDDFYYQRKQLMDAMLEQEKDCKLYEMICRAVLGERELKKIVDKCKYDDEKDEWIVPFIKRKNIDLEKFLGNGGGASAAVIATAAGGGTGEYGFASGNNSNHISPNNSFFPDIHNPNAGHGASNPSSANSSFTGKSALEQKFSTLQSNSWAINASIQEGDEPVSNNRRPASQSRRVRSSRGRDTASPNEFLPDNAAASSSLDYPASSSSRGKSPLVPLLTLPGSLVAASSLISPKTNNNGKSGQYYGKSSSSSNTSARGGGGGEDYYYSSTTNLSQQQQQQTGLSLPGIGFTADSEDLPKAKASKTSKNKLPKAIKGASNTEDSHSSHSTNSQSDGRRMPSISQNHHHSSQSYAQQQQQQYSQNAALNSYQQTTDYANVDEMGTGETAGPLHDWGFANNDSIASEATAPISDREYYPNNGNYTFVPQDGKKSSHGNKKKKAHSKDSSGGASLFPPIDGKTPRGGGLSLPPI